MDISDRPVVPLPRRRIAAFVALFALLYAGAAGIAEVTIGRSGQETAFQKLLAMRGTQVDWLVLGASHALPLAFGDIPKRLEADTGQSMAVLAEVGAGPLYNGFVFRQAKRDIAPRHLLYVVDSFAFTSPRWNEERITDRKLLRKTPLRPSTAAIMADLTIRRGIKPTALADYLTAFSKLNTGPFPARGLARGRRFRQPGSPVAPRRPKPDRLPLPRSGANGRTERLFRRVVFDVRRGPGGWHAGRGRQAPPAGTISRGPAQRGGFQRGPAHAPSLA